VSPERQPFPSAINAGFRRKPVLFKVLAGVAGFCLLWGILYLIGSLIN